MMKQTEIGLIPDDWEVKEFKQEATLINGRAYAQSELLKQGKYKVLRVGNFGTNDNWYYSNLELPEKQYCTKGDLLYCWSCTYGAYIWNEPNTIYHYHIWKIISKGADKEYLKYILNNDTENQMKSSNGSTMAHITKGFLENRLFAFPPFSEQQRIAKALSDVDALISTTEKLIQKKKNIKQGTMQNLLTGKKRLPGFGPQTKSPAYKQTELGPIPEDWEVKSLGEIFEFRPNNTFTRDCLNDSKGKYQNVHYGDVLIKYPSILDCSKETIPFINEGINVKFSKYGIVEGDIIIADTAEDETVGKVVEIFNLGEKKIVSGLHTFLCRKITDDFAPKWLGYFMNQAIFHNKLLPFITGTKVSAISRTAIQNVKVLIPSKEEQTAIANVLSSMDKEIETLNTKLEKYRNLKTAMMQQLLTGKIRLVK